LDQGCLSYGLFRFCTGRSGAVEHLGDTRFVVFLSLSKQMLQFKQCIYIFCWFQIMHPLEGQVSQRTLYTMRTEDLLVTDELLCRSFSRYKHV